MGRTELVTIVATGLALAVLLGWCLRWMFGKLNRPKAAEPIPESELEARLRAAEAERDAAVQEFFALEDRLGGQLREARAEMEAAMDGLRSARQETESLRARLGG